MESNWKGKDQVEDDERFWGIERTTLQVELIKKLREVSNDPEFILSILTYAHHEEDTKYMIDYINAGEDVTYSQLILQALYLSRLRKGDIRPT